MMRYGSFNEALSDVLRFSKGMTYKNIMAGLPYGGGNVGRIAGMLHELFVRADAEKLPSSMVADAMAQERLARRAERPRKSPRSLRPGAKPFNRFEFCQHRMVLFLPAKTAGLTAMIGVHDTKVGPSEPKPSCPGG